MLVWTCTTTICLLNENGRRVFTRDVRGPWSRLLGEVERIRGPFAVCFEASTGYGYLYEPLSRIARRVVVAHPGQLRLIFGSKKKNDRVDALKLAKLLYLDAVPRAHVPSAEIRSWRSLIEHRHRLVFERTRAKNQLRALLRRHGLSAPRGLWSKKGMAWLAEQVFPLAIDALQRDVLSERLCSTTAMIRRVEQVLAQEARKHPGVALLLTIPGVGLRTAEAVMAYVDDPRRFGDAKDVGSCFGLVPCQDASAGMNRLGHITRQGPATVRHVLVEAAWQGIRHSARLRVFYERIHKGNPERKKVALVATARRLVCVMVKMLQTG